MNSRHAAALALVGWYLMSAPEVGSGFNPTLPLAMWKDDGSFDTAKACMDKRAEIVQRLQKDIVIYDNPAPDGYNKAPDQYSAIAKLVRCIASDDPRLKETK